MDFVPFFYDSLMYHLLSLRPCDFETLFVTFSPPCLYLVLKIILLFLFLLFCNEMIFSIHDASPRQGLERHPFGAQRKKIQRKARRRKPGRPAF